MYTVVVADDEPELREAIVKRVEWEKIGFQVVGKAENGSEALDLVSRLEPDLLLTDIRMPFISGIDLAREVREVRPATQIAFLSGFDEFTYAQQAIQYNIISYLLKPISVAELTEELKKIKGKIDKIFEDFAKIQKGEVSTGADFFLPLLLNNFYFESSKERESRLQEEQKNLGLLGPGREDWNYEVLSIILRDKSGKNCTMQNHLHGVQSILQKYMETFSFYIDGRIVSVLHASRNSIQKYLHILAADIVQSMGRILGLRCTVGIGKETDKIMGLYDSCMDSARALSYDKGTERRIFYISDMKVAEKTPDVCERALEKMDHEYGNPELSLISVSNEIGISPNYLSMLIKRKTGKTFIDYLTGQRMKAAQKMIRETDLKIREVSERCGYNDQHYFSYCFKKYAGISPNILRRQMKEELENE